jgi:hypothetical protein
MFYQEIKDFFSDFHGGEPTNFRSIKGGNVKDLNRHYNKHTEGVLQQLNKQGYEIYFVPNTGGYKNQQITKFNCVFVDLDCGRDSKGNYYEIDFVGEYKEIKLSELRDFVYHPSYIVETRNGLHAYWLLEDGVKLEQFKECELRLIDYFNGDKAVKNPARLLRVPSYYWMKDPQSPFKTKLLESEGTRFKINDLIDSLPKIEGKAGREKSPTNKNCTFLISGPKPTPSANVEMVELIENRDVEALHEVLNPNPINFETHEEIYDYLKEQDLSEFLGLGGCNFNCIFHDDRTPSAGIIKNDDNGHHIYNCLSGSCNVSYNIIQVVEQLTGMDTKSSLEFLRTVYKVDYKDSEWKQKRIACLESNEKLLLSSDLEEEHKKLNQFVNRYSTLLLFFHKYCQKNIYTKNYTDNKGNPVFFVSNNYLASKLNKDRKSITQQVSILAYLGLIRKLPKEEIPKDLLMKSIEFAKSRNQPRIISYFSIPIYNEDLIDFASKKAMEYKQYGFSVKGFGREMIYRALGEEEANRVYPQEKGKTLSEKSMNNAIDIEKILMSLIEDKSWTTEKEVVEVLDEMFGKQSYHQNMLKRISPEIIDKYALEKRRLNKELKTKLGIITNGYPNIILRRY